MKRLFTFLALVLGLVSCQTEGFDVNVGGEQDVNITVSLPEGTRADSALGAFDNVNFDEYDVRFQCEVHYNGEVKELPVQISDNGKSATFPVRLIANRNYTFVVWADLVKEGETADLHYNTADLTNITLKNDTWVAMDETRDAFTCSEDRTFNRSQDINLTLTRPFAKLRVITTDMLELMGIEPTTVKVVYTTKHYEGFNALNQTPVEKLLNKTHEATAIFNYGETGENKTLFTDYFFAQEGDIVNFSMNVYDKSGVVIDEQKDFNTAIPVNRNYVTTIKGNILTYADDFTVNILPGFDNAGNIDEAPYYNEIVEVGNATNLQEAINNATENTTIVLGGDIDLGELFGASIFSTRAAAALPIVIAEGKVAVLDLNGHTITTPWEDEAAQKHYYAFENRGSLTIQDSKGNGKIIARGNFNYGTMTLKSGIINACDGNGGYGVRNYEGAEFVMNGGSIVTSKEDGDTPGNGYDASPVRVDEGATATINGGAINNVSNYTVAIDNYGTTTINDGTFTTIHTTIANSATMTINGGSFTCNGLEGITAHALWAAAGTTTINGGTFDGKDNYNGFNVSASKGATVNIKGGKFLPVHSGSLYGEGTINVMGGTFFDDPSLRVVKGYVVEKNGDVFEVNQIALEANFADNSWDKIILACQNDIVPETWAVGNKKEMTIDGKTYEIAIIGKNHDTYTGGDTKAPLTFQLFQLYGTAAQMNETQDNTTGWSGSKMRNTTMADILNVMPDAVKNAIKAVDKVSLNGSKSALETTSDKLFLLSEIEVNGSTYYSGGYVEGSRYAYYADQIMDSKGNIISQIMKPNGTIVSWYLRTPKNDKDDDTRFVAINGSGYMTHITAEIASGVIFGFCF